MAWALSARGAMPIGKAADEFERLFFGLYPQICAISVRAGLDAAEAEDVAQEAFVQFHRRHDPGEPFAAAWLRRAALHLALNAVRGRRRRESREERDAARSAPVIGDAGHRANPALVLERAERRSAVRAAMARLPRRYAAVLVLRYSGSSYAEIAGATGMPVTHVGTTLRRAELAFKKEFDHASLG